MSNRVGGSALFYGVCMYSNILVHWMCEYMLHVLCTCQVGGIYVNMYVHVVVCVDHSLCLGVARPPCSVD